MDDKPSADVAASEVQESGSTETPRPAAGSDLWQMFAPMTGFFREFFRKDHSQYQQRLIGALLVVGLIVGGLGWKVFDSQTTQARQQAWGSWIDVPADIQKEIVKSLGKGEMPVSRDSFAAEEYQNFLAEPENADAMVRAWAKLLLAESRLNDGLRRAYQSNKQAKRKNGSRRLGRNGDVQNAIGHFEELLVDAPKGSLLEQRALYGRAVGLEASFNGTDEELSKVKAAYNRLEETDGPYKILAEKRLEAINSEGTKAFYKWFAKVETAPEREADPAQSKTGDNSPIKSPLLDKLLRDDNGTEKSSASPDAADDVKKKIPLLPLKKPAAEKKKPAAEKKKPAAEKKKPAAEKKKPAAEKKKAGE